MPTTPRPSPARRPGAVLLAAAVALVALVVLGGCAPSPARPGPPAAGGTQTVTATIELTRDFDGGGRTYRGGGGLGGGGDGEGRDPIFRVAPGVTVSNLVIGAPGADGIHCRGTCTLRNIVWQDVLDDAATLKGSGPGDVMTIDGGSARNASDKVFQHNGSGTVVIRNFTVENFGKLYRSCGNCSPQYPRQVRIESVTAIGPGKELAGINENQGDTADFTAVTVRNDAARKLVTCGRYRGVTSGEAVKVGTGASAGCRGTETVVWR